MRKRIAILLEMFMWVRMRRGFRQHMSASNQYVIGNARGRLLFQPTVASYSASQETYYSNDPWPWQALVDEMFSAQYI